ncbi:MAG TPA: hypothetical protein VFQ67_05205 [Allosphingosinicella sp.]|nr:hypothetical protein [Allosphingosinicella sp.]
MAGLRLDTLAVMKRLTAAGMDSRAAGELAEALTEQAVDLHMKINDVEVRLAWLRLYGIWVACTFFLVLIERM